MKTPKHLLPLIVLAIGLLAAACSSESPVEKMADFYTSAASDISSAQSETDVVQLIGKQEAKGAEIIDRLLDDQADYVLTDNDKALFKKAFAEYYRACLVKSVQLSGADTAGIDETVAYTMESMIYPKVDQATKLGDLAGSGNGK